MEKEETVKMWHYTDFTELERRCMADFLATTTIEELKNDPYTLFAEKHNMSRTETKALLSLSMYSNWPLYKKGEYDVL